MMSKRVLRNVVFLGIALSLLAFAVWEIRLTAYTPDPDYVDRIVNHITQDGVSPLWDLEVVVKTGAPFRSMRWGVCVVRVPPVHDQAETVLVCVNEQKGPLQTMDGLVELAPSPVVFSPSGQPYKIRFAAEIMPPWIQITLNVAAMAGIVGAWVALALWIYSDAQTRVTKAAPAWLLIGLLTGPVGLAVWLVARGDDPGAHCTHCGAPHVAGTVFCVNCGKPLQLLCPACGKPVREGWMHCGACGAPLNVSGGGDNRVLADEDRAG